MQSPCFFVGLPTISNSRVRKFRTPHSDSDTGSKNLDSDSGPKIRLQLCLWDLLCDIIIVYLRMTLQKFLNSSDKRCTTVYRVLVVK